MTRASSTAAKADKAFSRLVRMTSSKGMPQWPTLAEMAKGMHKGGPNNRGWRNEMTDRQYDQFAADYQMVESALGRIPWTWAYAMTAPGAKKKEAAK